MDISSSAKVNKEYPLNCEIYTKIKYYEDEDINGKKFKASTTMFYFVPRESTTKVLFLDAWLPSVESETYEVVGIVHSPINKPARFGVKMGNHDCNEHHLYVMTSEIEDEIKKFVDWSRKEGSCRKGGYPSIKITILPQNQEEELNV